MATEKIDRLMVKAPDGTETEALLSPLVENIQGLTRLHRVSAAGTDDLIIKRGRRLRRITLTGLLEWLANAFADKSHTHAATDVNSGTLSSARLPTVPVYKGGTGGTTAATARANLGAASVESPTFTGTPKAPSSSTSYTTYQLRNVALMTELPSSIGNGQIVLIYE